LSRLELLILQLTPKILYPHRHNLNQKKLKISSILPIPLKGEKGFSLGFGLTAPAGLSAMARNINGLEQKMADGINPSSSPHIRTHPQKGCEWDASKPSARGLSQERLKHLSDIKEQISKGFYNSDKVVDDLSHSFTKAVDVLI